MIDAMRGLGRRLPWILAVAALAAAGCRQQPQQRAETQPTSPAPATIAKMRVGGEDVVTLERKATSQGTKPEFLSVTILPGRGMNVFELMANIPGRGEIPLLVSPPIAEAASQLNGTGKDQYGNLSFSFGGAFLIPYPNRILGKLSADGKSVITDWRGHTLALPANWQADKPGARRHAMHGLILDAKAVDLQTQTTADGQTETGVIRAGNFNGHWLSDTDLNFTIALTGPAIDVTITARNIGKEAEPMSIGWHPYFAIPSGDRSQARLHLPGSMIADENNYDDVFPTGRLKPVRGTIYDYEAPAGVPLDGHSLDDNFSHLTRTNGAVRVRLIDPKIDYGIQLEGLSPEIRTVQVYAPPGKSFVAIEPQFNYADPFGVEWRGMETGMVTLRPGQAVTWKVRLELLTPQKPSP
jgi:aldose 1-epimerase